LSLPLDPDPESEREAEVEKRGNDPRLFCSGTRGTLPVSLGSGEGEGSSSGMRSCEIWVSSPVYSESESLSIIWMPPASESESSSRD
jgi:hypothetical protein